MPIRFRCAYCNQLMGIARRKTGTVVRCPNCAGQVVVPRPEGAKGAEPGEAKPAHPEQPFFEQNDFDEALSAAAPGARPVLPASEPNSPSRPIPAPATFQGSAPVYEPEVEAQSQYASELPAPAAPPGIFLSPVMATALSVAFVLALALAFIVGLFVGRSLYAPPREERTVRTELRQTSDFPGWVAESKLV